MNNKIIFDLENLGRGREGSTTFAMVTFSGKYRPPLGDFEIFTFQSSWPWKCRSMSRCTAFAVAPFNGKYPTFCVMAIVMFALSLTICEIFAKLIKCRVWPWKWRSSSRRRKTELAPFDSKFSIPYSLCFQNFSYLEMYVYAISNTHKQTPTYTQAYIHTLK